MATRPGRMGPEEPNFNFQLTIALFCGCSATVCKCGSCEAPATTAQETTSDRTRPLCEKDRNLAEWLRGFYKQVHFRFEHLNSILLQKEFKGDKRATRLVRRFKRNRSSQMDIYVSLLKSTKPESRPTTLQPTLKPTAGRHDSSSPTPSRGRTRTVQLPGTKSGNTNLGGVQ